MHSKTIEKQTMVCISLRFVASTKNIYFKSAVANLVAKKMTKIVKSDSVFKKKSFFFCKKARAIINREFGRGDLVYSDFTDELIPRCSYLLHNPSSSSFFFFSIYLSYFRLFKFSLETESFTTGEKGEKKT